MSTWVHCQLFYCQVVMCKPIALRFKGNFGSVVITGHRDSSAGLSRLYVVLYCYGQASCLPAGARDSPIVTLSPKKIFHSSKFCTSPKFIIFAIVRCHISIFKKFSENIVF